VSWKLPDPLVDQKSWEDERQGVQRNFKEISERHPLECSTDNFRQVPQARAYHNAAQGTTSGAFLVPALNSERWDLGTPSLNMHDTATNNSRLTCRVPGLYRVAAHIEWANAATGRRLCDVLLNGATVLARDDKTVSSSGDSSHSVSTAWRMVVGDYVEMRVLQASGGALNVQASGPWSCDLEMAWISP
jgi:hypothetical protein